MKPVAIPMGRPMIYFPMKCPMGSKIRPMGHIMGHSMGHLMGHPMDHPVVYPIGRPIYETRGNTHIGRRPMCSLCFHEMSHGMKTAMGRLMVYSMGRLMVCPMGRPMGRPMCSPRNVERTRISVRRQCFPWSVSTAEP